MSNKDKIDLCHKCGKREALYVHDDQLLCSICEHEIISRKYFSKLDKKKKEQE